jgi:hypothetical protein
VETLDPLTMGVPTVVRSGTLIGIPQEMQGFNLVFEVFQCEQLAEAPNGPSQYVYASVGDRLLSSAKLPDFQVPNPNLVPSLLCMSKPVETMKTAFPQLVHKLYIPPGTPNLMIALGPIRNDAAQFVINYSINFVDCELGPFFIPNPLKKFTPKEAATQCEKMNVSPVVASNTNVNMLKECTCIELNFALFLLILIQAMVFVLINLIFSVPTMHWKS